MRLLLAILFLAAGAYGQIANPTTASSLGLGTTDGVTFARLSVSNGAITNPAIQIGATNTGFSASESPSTIRAIAGGSALLSLFAGGFNVTPVATFSTNVTVAGTLGATGNATLSGVNNTAPLQAASSASSLITRDLIYQAQADFNSGDLITPAATITAGTGASASPFNTIGHGVQISIFTNSAAGAFLGDAVWSQSGSSGALMPANKEIDITFKGVMLRVEANTNFVNRMVFGVGAPNRTPPAARTQAATNMSWGVNFFYDGTNQVYEPFWFTTNYITGPIGVVPNLTDTSWAGRVYTIRLRQTAGGNIAFFINDGLSGRLSATPTWSTNVAWPSTTYGGRFIGMECASATNATVSTNARMHYRVAYIKYEP
jgi:hypothetical protein